jgi:endonuclease/exonuclease/phosphatase family metal-dependent hydrolase
MADGDMPDGDMPDGELFSLASYNIHRGIGADRRRNWGRILEVISALNVDVIALQEVETPTEPGPAAATTLALLPRLTALGYEPLLGPTLRNDHSHYGNLLLSRWPIKTRHLLDLSVPGREPRGLIEAELEQHGQRVGVMATHLGLGIRERRAQVARVAARIDHWQSQPSPPPLVLLGDFNHGFAWSSGLKPLRQRLSAAPARATYPARWPLLTLDRVFYTGLQLKAGGVARGLTSRQRQASDHRPVWACFA